MHEIMCFKAEQITVSATSAGANTPQSGRVQVGSQLYLASYYPKNWWGQLTANDVLVDDDTGMLTLSNRANWDANCRLTGGSCGATGGNVAVQAPADRKLFTWNGAGKVLSWPNLSAAQKTALDASASNASRSDVLDFLQGTRSQEMTTSGTGKFRMRDSVLGDIMNSSPVWVGKPQAPYAKAFADALYPTATAAEGASYAAYVKAKAQRTHVVYVGSNDGFVHGFRAGKFDANGAFDSSQNDGQELMAYMPAQVLETINPSDNDNLRFASTTYAHNAMVDATPATGDLYYGGAWHTWLVGGLGAGGNRTGVIADNTSIATGAIYALDVTSPEDFQGTNAARIVLGEWNSRNLVCATDTPTEKCADHLGSTYGTPLIRRLHNGHWAVLFGNGLNSKSGKAGIFVMIVNKDSGARTLRYLNAGEPTRTGNDITSRNGITQLASADLDLDHITDYIYAGDMLGNLWRFDLSSNSESNWQARTAPLFRTGGRPITTAPTVTSSLSGSDYRVILSFGTGKVYPQTLNASSYVVPGSQYLLGIWDHDLDSWNARSGVKYKALSAGKTADYADLQAQQITEVAQGNAAVGYSRVRTVSQNRVCWQGATLCPNGNDRYGWKMELPAANEQVIYNPTISGGMLVVNTTIPEVTQVLSCTAQSSAGFTMALLPDTGAAPARSYFKGITADGGIVAGLGLGGVGTTSNLSSSKQDFIVTNTNDGKAKIVNVDKTLSITPKRLTWIQRR
ncbi:pilus assembly protein [Comamonas endophytica]|uniref:pilus assembly protein n=1 Tax=Comamonas endophytica TaxID=2949090 RepID=UPI00361E74A2